MADPYITAASPSELRDALRSDISRLKSPTKLSETESSERWQMNHFLVGIAGPWDLGFPTQVIHTSDQNPDFVIVTPTQKIGVECSRISNESLGRLDHLDRSGQIQRPFSKSPFLVESKHRKTPQLMAAALGFGEWNAVSDEDRFWFKRADEALVRKTAAMDRMGYQSCDDYWLLVTDEMSLCDETLKRAEKLYRTCQDLWNSRERWFSRIVIQSESLDWQAEITRQGVGSRTIAPR